MLGKSHHRFQCVYKLKVTVRGHTDKDLPVIGDWVIDGRLIDHLCEVACDLPVVISKCRVDLVEHMFALKKDCTTHARNYINNTVRRISSFGVQAQTSHLGLG